MQSLRTRLFPTSLRLRVAARSSSALAIKERFEVMPTALFWIALALIAVTSASTLAQTTFAETDTVYSFTNPSIGKLNISFTEQMREAVSNGVPLSIELDFTYITPRLLLDNHSVTQRHQFKIMRHALSNRFMVLHNDKSRPELFATFLGITDYIGSESIRLFSDYTQETKNLITSDESVAHLRLALDKYKLPGPVRLSAFVSNQWDFDTGWITWDFEN